MQQVKEVFYPTRLTHTFEAAELVFLPLISNAKCLTLDVNEALP
jgi:hypothetical protein